MRQRFTRQMFVLAAALCLCLAAGALADLPLSQALYHPASILGRVGAAYGQAPQALALGAAGALLIRARRGGRVPSALNLGAGILLNLFAFYRLVVIPGAGMALPARAAVALVLLAVADGGVVRLLDSADARCVRRYALFVVAVVCLEALAVSELKDLWARPRMRLLASDPAVAFQPWWVIGSGQREAFGALGVAAEEFRSFPSGHTAAAACSIVLACAPAVQPKLTHWQVPLFWGGVAVTACVGLSRIIMGAHFLSDVAAGFLVTLATIAVLARLLLPQSAHPR